MLFKDSPKLLEYAQLTGINYASVKPTIRIVEDKHIVPVLGDELYLYLSNKYAGAENTLTDNDKLLLEYCRRAIGPYTAYYYTPKAEINVGDAGAQRIETSNNKSAYGYQVKNYREQMLSDAESATEALLKFLEDNKDKYPMWQTSAAFKDYRSLFIKGGVDFKLLFPSQSPFRNYWAMRPKMYDVEQNIIRPAIGTAFFDYLKDIDQSATLTYSIQEAALIQRIKKAIAYLTVGYALPFLAAKLDANGITVISIFNSVTSINDESRTAATDKTLELYIKSCISSGEAWLKSATDYATEHPAYFPLYPVVVVVTAPSTNCERTGSFGLM